MTSTDTHSVSVEDYRQLEAKRMTEKYLQEQVRQMCKDINALYYHTHRSQHSPSGYPDCTIITPDGRLIYAELKRQDAEPTEAQVEWLKALVRPGVDVHLWRPMDLIDGTIHAVITGESEEGK